MNGLLINATSTFAPSNRAALDLLDLIRFCRFCPSASIQPKTTRIAPPPVTTKTYVRSAHHGRSLGWPGVRTPQLSLLTPLAYLPPPRRIHLLRFCETAKRADYLEQAVVVRAV